MAAQILNKSSLNDVNLEERNKAKVICLGKYSYSRTDILLCYPKSYVVFITFLTRYTTPYPHHILFSNSLLLNIVGTIYGMGPALAASKLGIDVAAANRITNAFFNKYKDMKLWMMKIKK